MLHRSSTLKIFEAPHLRFFHTGEYLDVVRELAQSGEAFLTDMEKQWGIILPKTPFTVSVIRVKPQDSFLAHEFDPPWLFSRYDPESKRIELRANPKKMEIEPMVAALKHHLVHAILQLEQSQPLPGYLEEGLARRYAGSKGSRQVYWAILGFQRAEPIRPFLENPFTYQIDTDFQCAGALGYQFVTWLWEQHPQAEKPFLQGHLGGRSLDNALQAAGLDFEKDLIARFEETNRPKFGLGRLLKTYDFWLLFLSVVVLIAVAFKVIAAFRISRMEFIELTEAPKQVPKELFAGPAFEPQSKQHPASDAVAFSVPDLPTPPKRKPVEIDLGASGDDSFLPKMQPMITSENTIKESGFLLDTDEFGSLDDQLDAVFDQINLTENSSNSKTDNKIEQRRGKPGVEAINKEKDAEIDEDVDMFFSNLPTSDSNK